MGADVVRRHLPLLFIVGIALIALGLTAIAAPAVSSRVSVRFAGGVLLAAGVFQTVLGLMGGDRRTPARSLAVGLANVAAGGFFLVAPWAGALTLSLVLAVAYVIVGAYKAIGALRDRGPHWPWMVALGGLLVVFGTLIGARWPGSGIELVGRFVGINLTIEGITWLMIARQARKPVAPRVTLAPRAPQKGPVRK
jgi:uncharacterized membrane protein HdeD (DUF308 family)